MGLMVVQKLTVGAEVPCVDGLAVPQTLTVDWGLPEGVLEALIVDGVNPVGVDPVGAVPVVTG